MSNIHEVWGLRLALPTFYWGSWSGEFWLDARLGAKLHSGFLMVFRRDGHYFSGGTAKSPHPLQVTVSLVKEYIEPEEMVILCVIPAMSDFGNAEARSVFRVLAVASETLFFCLCFSPFFLGVLRQPLPFSVLT